MTAVEIKLEQRGITRGRKRWHFTALGWTKDGPLMIAQFLPKEVQDERTAYFAARDWLQKQQQLHKPKSFSDIEYQLSKQEQWEKRKVEELRAWREMGHSTLF